MSSSPQDSSNPYEATKAVNEYMAFHYTPLEEYMSYVFGPKEALDFPKRCAELCLRHKPVSVLLAYMQDSLILLLSPHNYRRESWIGLLILAVQWGGPPSSWPGSSLRWWGWTTPRLSSPSARSWRQWVRLATSSRQRGYLEMKRRLALTPAL